MSDADMYIFHHEIDTFLRNIYFLFNLLRTDDSV